jgi:hypothetical protein
MAVWLVNDEVEVDDKSVDLTKVIITESKNSYFELSVNNS